MTEAYEILAHTPELARLRLELATMNRANARGHSTQLASRTAFERLVARVAVKRLGLPPANDNRRYSVKLTRQAPTKHLFDDDNAIASLKAVRDGVADGLGTHDGRKGPLRFSYGEQEDSERFGVLIEISPRPQPP